MDADQAERPSPRRGEPCQRRQSQREELSRHYLEAPKGRTPHACAQRTERPPVTVLRTGLVQPVPLKTQVVVEAFPFEIKSVMKERPGGGGQCLHRLRILAQLTEQHCQYERTGIIIGAIAF